MPVNWGRMGQHQGLAPFFLSPPYYIWPYVIIYNIRSRYGLVIAIIHTLV